MSGLHTIQFLHARTLKTKPASSLHQFQRAKHERTARKRVPRGQARRSPEVPPWLAGQVFADEAAAQVAASGSAATHGGKVVQLQATTVGVLPDNWLRGAVEASQLTAQKLGPQALNDGLLAKNISGLTRVWAHDEQVRAENHDKYAILPLITVTWGHFVEDDYGVTHFQYQSETFYVDEIEPQVDTSTTEKEDRPSKDADDDLDISDLIHEPQTPSGSASGQGEQGYFYFDEYGAVILYTPPPQPDPMDGDDEPDEEHPTDSDEPPRAPTEKERRDANRANKNKTSFCWEPGECWEVPNLSWSVAQLPINHDLDFLAPPSFAAGIQFLKAPVTYTAYVQANVKARW